MLEEVCEEVEHLRAAGHQVDQQQPPDSAYVPIDVLGCDLAKLHGARPRIGRVDVGAVEEVREAAREARREPRARRGEARQPAIDAPAERSELSAAEPALERLEDARKELFEQPLVEEVERRRRGALEDIEAWHVQSLVGVGMEADRTQRVRAPVVAVGEA